MVSSNTSTGEAPAAPTPAPRPLPGRLRYRLYAVVVGIVVVLDQATKLIADRSLTLGRPVDSSVPFVDWQLVTNAGGAFGIPGFTGMFLVVTIVVLVLVAKALPRADRLSMALAYGLVSGGALGNVADRMFRAPGFPDGEVVDFVRLGWWPNFNLADMAIVVGAAMIVVLLWRVDRDVRQREEAAAARQSVRPETIAPQGHARGRGWLPVTTRSTAGVAPGGDSDEARP